METETHSIRLLDALVALQQRYTNPKFHWHLKQVHGNFTCIVRRLSDGTEVQSTSTDMAAAVENTLALCQRQFVHPPVKKGGA